MNKVLVDIRDEVVAKYFNGKDLVTIDDLLDKIDELAYDLDRTQVELEEVKADMAENYRPINWGKEYGE